MKLCAAVLTLLVVAGAADANVPAPPQVLVQFSVGTGTTLVGFKVLKNQAADAATAVAPGSLILRLPFNCAFVLENALADGSGVVVRPKFGPIAFEVAVSQKRPNGS